MSRPGYLLVLGVGGCHEWVGGSGVAAPQLIPIGMPERDQVGWGMRGSRRVRVETGRYPQLIVSPVKRGHRGEGRVCGGKFQGQRAVVWFEYTGLSPRVATLFCTEYTRHWLHFRFTLSRTVALTFTVALAQFHVVKC